MSKEEKETKEKREKFVLQIAGTCVRCKRRNAGLMFSYAHLLLKKLCQYSIRESFFLLEYTQVEVNLTLPL
jgi:hypothetical protein